MAKKEFHFSEFLVTEHNRYGKSIPIYFRIPPDLARRLYILLESGKLPFQTKEELARWAFYLGVRSLEEIKHFDCSSPLLELPLALYGEGTPIGACDFFNRVHRIVRDLSALGYRTPVLNEFIATVEKLIQCLPSKHDREEYLGMFEKRRWELLEAAKWPAHPSRKGYRAR
jgi:hypothetical protein